MSLVTEATTTTGSLCRPGAAVLVGAIVETVGIAHVQSNRFDDWSIMPFEQNRPTKHNVQLVVGATSSRTA